MTSLLIFLYPWIKALHVIAVISWMAGIFYLPRLFVYHAEAVAGNKGMAATFAMMERKLLRVIMRPAMVVTWICGLLLVATPGVVDWSLAWPWFKGAAVLAMTGFHGWAGLRCREFEEGRNTRGGRYYRLMNEVPTVLMIVIVVSVIVKF